MTLPTIQNWTRVYTGKIHDVFVPVDTLAHSGNETIMLVVSDRMSVLDRVLPTMVPGKGEIVNSISAWWFKQLAGVMPNHMLADPVPDVVANRAMIVQRLRMFPIECTVIGYLTMRTRDEYERHGSVGGVQQPGGLKIGDKLPEPVFLPSLKGEVGHDDETITFDRMVEIIGEEPAEHLREMSLLLYGRAQAIASEKGLVIADCKLEFGSSSDYGDDEFVLGDQAFTPDSATYWLESELSGGSPRAFGKDYVRYIVEDDVLNWIRGYGPAPVLSPEVVEEIRTRYSYVQSQLLGDSPRSSTSTAKSQ